MARTRNFARLAARGVRGLEPYVPGKPVDELERQYGIRGAIKLASNENPLGPSPKAIEAMRSALADVAQYPDGGGFRLRHALAERLRVSPDQITLGNGSNDILVLLAETFLSPRAEAVYSEFAFIVYRLAVQATGATARIAPARAPNLRQPYGHDLDALLKAICPRTRIVFIANPNNPTGTWLESEELHGFLSSVPADVIVVLDEAYGEYVSDIDYPDALPWIRTFPNLVITRTFSKIYGLAGVRVGYAVSNPQVAGLLNRVRQPFNVNSLGQVAAMASLGDEDHVARSREVNARGLIQLTDGLAKLGIHAARSAGNFVLADVAQPAGPLYERLLRAGVIVRPVANYGLPRHLRITAGLPEQNGRFLQVLEAALGQSMVDPA